MNWCMIEKNSEIDHYIKGENLSQMVHNVEFF